MIIEKNISEIRVGMYLVDITLPKGKFKLTEAGLIENETIIDRFKNKGIERVLIDMDKSINMPKARKASAAGKPQDKFFQEEIVKARQIFNQSKNIQKKLFHDAENGCPLDLKSVSRVTDESIELIFNNPDALAYVLNIRNKDEYLLEHSVAVSVLISIFAFHLKMDKEVVRKLAVGGFLHDVGKIKVPEAILNKPGKLTDPEFEIMKSHASHSIEIISKTADISALSLEVAAQHHEKLNGEGYPNGLKENKISIYGRMIAVCDIFDALTSNRCYKQGYAQVKAFSILRSLAKNKHLDSELVDQFIHCMGVYPVGALVQLDSNKLAIVESHNRQDPIRPNVRPFYSLGPKNFEFGHHIDLSEMLEEQIVKCVRADDFDLNMEQIMEFLAHEG
ncbi:HD-GYP domain-containing protein [Psychromonas ossibalaenae]|uniref:HD-GYP domain-containing protein n=1 Tax=Psychromonas ossibalaenae TaxID=444922 RepID=UPI00037214C4|nr:HD-GYP domain-containing protein [Psychromonas ossibalaenae]